MQWFERVTQGDTVNAAAEKAHMVGSTLNRQVRAATLSPESIVAIARAYDADPIEGLIISGLITDLDLHHHRGETLLAHLSNKMLADEVWRRMQLGRDNAHDINPPVRLHALKDSSDENLSELDYTIIDKRRAADDPGIDIAMEQEGMEEYP